MKYLLYDRLSDGSLFKVRLNASYPFISSDHRDYHPHYEIYYNRGGLSQDVTINDKTIVTDTPTVVLLTPFTVHRMTPHFGEDPFESRVLHFRESTLEAVSAEMLPRDWKDGVTNCVYPLTAGQNDELYGIFSMIEKYESDTLVVKSLFALFINLLFTLVPPEKRVRAGKTDRLVSSMLSYIYDNIGSIHSTRDVAEAFSLSVSTIDRSFKSQLGISPHAVIVNCRVARAMDYLTGGDMPISTVAQLCGFDSEYYFYTFFKKRTGRTPSSFRK